MKLHLGCGTNRLSGFINIDYKPSPAVDLIHDLNMPLPFQDASVDHIYTSHTLEHLNSWEECIKECHRVLKTEGTLEVIVPYGFKPRAYHRAYFVEESFDAFTYEQTTSNEAEHLFDVVDMHIHRATPFRWHLSHYMHLNLPEFSAIGRKYELHGTFVKSERERCNESNV